MNRWNKIIDCCFVNSKNNKEKVVVKDIILGSVSGNALTNQNTCQSSLFQVSEIKNGIYKITKITDGTELAKFLQTNFIPSDSNLNNLLGSFTLATKEAAYKTFSKSVNLDYPWIITREKQASFTFEPKNDPFMFIFIKGRSIQPIITSINVDLFVDTFSSMSLKNNIRRQSNSIYETCNEKICDTHVHGKVYYYEITLNLNMGIQSEDFISDLSIKLNTCN